MAKGCACARATRMPESARCSTRSTSIVEVLATRGEVASTAGELPLHWERQVHCGPFWFGCDEEEPWWCA